MRRALLFILAFYPTILLADQVYPIFIPYGDHRSEKEKQDEYEKRQRENVARDHQYARTDLKNIRGMDPKKVRELALRKEHFDWTTFWCAVTVIGCLSLFFGAMMWGL